MVTLLVASNCAFAQQTESVDPAANFVPTKTRAEVYAELVQAKADGSYYVLHQEYVDPAANFVSTRTREEVLAELAKAKADGSLDARNKEIYAY